MISKPFAQSVLASRREAEEGNGRQSCKEKGRSLLCRGSFTNAGVADLAARSVSVAEVCSRPENLPTVSIKESMAPGADGRILFVSTTYE